MVSKYLEKKKSALSMIDIAINSLINFPPSQLNEQQVEAFIQFYKKSREQVENPRLEHRSIKSLSFIENNVLIFFNESNEEAVKIFWDGIRKANLPYKRKDHIQRILKKGRISNKNDYDIVIDLIIPYKQNELINNEEFISLNNMLDNYNK